MKRTILAITISLGYLIAFSQADNAFYYAFAEEINLNPVTDRFTVEFIEIPDESTFDDNNLNFSVISQNFYEIEGELSKIQSVGQGLYSINPVYETDDGLRMFMKNSIILQWNEDASQSQRSAIIDQYGLNMD